MTTVGALAPGAFVARLRQAGARRYHDTHPFHVRMHDGRCTRLELQQWVANRWYYQTRIPLKDALIVSKSEDSAFRRRWLRRIQEQDGTGDDEGGLARWLRLAEGVGLGRDDVLAQSFVLPRVRAACDGYVDLVRDGTLVEAVAASLTECFAPDLMAARVRAWERHYPWVDSDALAYFRSRIVQARSDGGFALAFVAEHATTAPEQDRCVGALIRKAEILNELLDAVSDAWVVDGRNDAEPAGSPLDRRPRLAPKARLRVDRVGGDLVLLAPERGLALNRTAAALLQLCDGRRTLRGIADELRARCTVPAAADVEREVTEFVARLAARGLVVED